jgi:predicted AAA+ superfamily ATPase
MQSLETTKTELFGQLDAFDENDEVFENYFLETNIYKKIKGKEKFYIIVGEKGTGKSALLKMCMINNEKNEEVVVDIKRPQITEKVQVSKLVDLWKDSLSKNIVDEIEKNVSG